MISIATNTYISTFLSQKTSWTIDELIKSFEKLLVPFDAKVINDLDPSNDVVFLKRVIEELPYKIYSYKHIVDKLSEDKGLNAEELSINVFNADLGFDLIAFLTNLFEKKKEIRKLKSIRLFDARSNNLSKALMLIKSIFPELNVRV